MKVAPIHFAIVSSFISDYFKTASLRFTDMDSLYTMYIFKDKEIRYDGLEKIKD